MDRRRYFGQFLALFTGTAAAQVFNLASYPLLSRIYSPAAFGLFGTFVAASAIPGAIACGRFELAIATAPQTGKRAMLWLCWSVALVVALAATLLVSVYWRRTATPALGLMAPMFLLTVLLTGVTSSTTMYLVRHDSFRFASAGVVARTGCTVIVQVALALTWRSPLGLIVGFCFGLAAQAALAVAVAARGHGIGGPRIDEMREMFRAFRPQVSVDLPGTLLAALSANLIPFFLQFLYGIGAVGFFSIGQRIALLPLQLFNDSLSQVFFQRAARAREERGEFWSEFRFTLFWSGLISLAMLGGLVLLAKPVVVIYLGSQWKLAGTILVILAPMVAIRGVTMSLATAVFVLRRPAWLLWHNVASLAAMALAFGFAWASGLGLLGFIGLLALLQGAEYLVFCVVLSLASRRNALEVARAQASRLAAD